MFAISKSAPEIGLTCLDCEVPEPGPNDVRIQVKRSAICGTDHQIYKWGEWAQAVIQPPVIIGHEFAGVVDAVGNQVTDVAVGQSVTAEGHMFCGNCTACQTENYHFCPSVVGIGIHRNGGFAEYVCVPARNVWSVPDVSMDVLSIFDPLGNAVHTVDAFDVTGQSILITGAGPIGLMAAQVARAYGARQIIISDISAYRLDIARSLGLGHTVNVSRESLSDAIHSIAGPNGIDIGFEMSGHPSALADQITALRPGGQLAILGLIPQKTQVDWSKLIFKMLTLKFIYGRKIFRTWHQVTGLIKAGYDPTPLVTHTIPAREFESAFELIASGNCMKILLDWESV